MSLTVRKTPRPEKYEQMLEARKRRVELIEQLHRAERERAAVAFAEAQRFVNDDQEARQP